MSDFLLAILFFTMFISMNACFPNIKMASFFFNVCPMAGLREWFAQSDQRNAPSRIPVMVNMTSASVSSRKSQKLQEASVGFDQVSNANRNSMMIDEDSEEDEEFQIAEAEQEVPFMLQ